MMTSGTDPLEAAIPHPFHVRFYVDAYHSYLLAKAAIDLQRDFLARILKRLPTYERYFDPNPSVEKRAGIVASLLEYAGARLVRTEEAGLVDRSVDVLLSDDILRLKNPFLLAARKPRNISGKTFVEAYFFGTVFRPDFDKVRISQDLDSFINELRVDGSNYKPQLRELENLRQQLASGQFEVSQNFYDTLAEIVGKASNRGFLRLSRDTRRKIEIGEKGVDGDFIATLAFDAADDLADVYVLLTNDADHAPAVDHMRSRGHRVAVVTYGNRPAAALRRAVGEGNFLNLLADDREFDFNPIWLLTDNKEGWDVLEDMRRQWLWWKANGMVGD